MKKFEELKKWEVDACCKYHKSFKRKYAICIAGQTSIYFKAREDAINKFFFKNLNPYDWNGWGNGVIIIRIRKTMSISNMRFLYPNWSRTCAWYASSPCLDFSSCYPTLREAYNAFREIFLKIRSGDKTLLKQKQSCQI